MTRREACKTWLGVWGKKSRGIYQKNYQLDVGRVEFLQKGTHDEQFAKTPHGVLERDQEFGGPRVFLCASALGKYFNPKVEDMRMSQVLLFDAEHAKAAFPNFYSYLESENEYIEGRVKDARAALENDPSTPGSFSQLEGFGIAEDLFHPIGTLTNLDKPGAQGQVVCSRGGARREGALAVPLAGMASVISPIDEPIIVTITNIGTITQIGGITLGSSYCKWLETDEAADFFEKEVVKLYVQPKEVLYLPFSAWVHIVYMEEPARGRDKKKAKVGDSAYIHIPCGFADQAKGFDENIFKAMKQNNFQAFEKKSQKAVWKDRKAYFTAVLGPM